MSSGAAAFSAASSSAASSASASEPPPTDEPLHDCRLDGFAHPVRCGALRRPLDPSRPDGAAIRVRYVLVPALAREKRPDPIFFLAGGPGQSAIEAAPQVMPLFGRLNNRRDIVFVDQRGTGGSTPLDCAGEAAGESIGDAAIETQLAELAACRKALVARPALRSPGALGFFTTSIAAGDFDAVRQVLAVPRIDLVGVSYGTRLALEYLRQFPGNVRRVVLDSVAPPDMALPTSLAVDGQAALDATFDACEREAACRAAHPRLRPDWQALLDRLPQTVEVDDPSTGRRASRRLTRDQVVGAVRAALYRPSVAAALPAAIGAAAAGRYDGLIGLGALLSPKRGGKLAIGLHFSVVCSEDLAPTDATLPAATPSAVQAFGASTIELYRRACADWPRGSVPAAFRSVPPAAAETLLLSGGLDPATPTRHARRVAAALGPKAQSIEVPNGGHNLLGTGCAPDLLFRFIDAPEAAPDLRGAASDCLRRLPQPPAFALPAGPSGRASEPGR